MKPSRNLLTCLLALSCLALPGCAARPTSPAPVATASILAGSSPAADSIVSSPVENLELTFDPPARLDEVTLSGTAGTMPIMVHAVGEVAHYSLPVSGIGPGTYTVSWRATAQGIEHRGRFQFTAR